jgi:hypothetical protein
MLVNPNFDIDGNARDIPAFVPEPSTLFLVQKEFLAGHFH